CSAALVGHQLLRHPQPLVQARARFRGREGQQAQALARGFGHLNDSPPFLHVESLRHRLSPERRPPCPPPPPAPPPTPPRSWPRPSPAPPTSWSCRGPAWRGSWG